MYGNYKQAGTDNFELANFSSGGTLQDFNPRDMFTADQKFNTTSQENPWVQYDGGRIFTGYVWPIGNVTNEKEWLEDAFEATGAVGIAALLFIHHKDHQKMDYIPSYLSNPAFLNEHGEALKKTLSKFMSGNVRNDVLYRYQRLLQIHPIMFDTMNWLDAFHQDQIGAKLYRFGIPDAFPFIKPENVDVDMIHEAIQNAKVNAAKRLVPPSTPQFVEMYAQLLSHGGADLVHANELVSLALMDWRLAYSYIKAKELSFNDALSVIMTFVYKRGNDVSPYDNYVILEKLFEDYGPSDQWPALDNVVRHVNAVTGDKAAQAQRLSNLAPARQPQETSFAPPMTNRAVFE